MIDTLSVLQAGASMIAVALDCLRRLGLDQLIQSANANSFGHGKVPKLVLTLGNEKTLVTLQ